MLKEDFLNKLRKNTHVQFDMPAVDVKGIQYEDTLKQFIEMTESVGGHVIEAKEGESLDELVKKAYPEAKVFASICQKSRLPRRTLIRWLRLTT